MVDAAPSRHPIEIAGPAPPRGWLRRTLGLAQHRHATWLLAAVAFADSSFLPVPPDLLLIPMCLVRPRRTRFLMLVCIAGSSAGAALGYLIGYGLWQSIGERLVELYGCAESFAAYRELVQQWGAAIIIGKAFTPIPFKIAAIAAGVGAMNPWAFMVATIVGRTVHFAMIAVLLHFFGARLLAFVSRYERPLGVVSGLAVVGFALYWCFR